MKDAGGRARRLGVPLAGALGSGVLLTLFARFEAPWVALAWVAMVPWLAAVDRARSWRGAVASGLVLGAAYTTSIHGWFSGALQSYSQAPAWLCWAVLVLLSPLLQPQFPVVALARVLARRWVTGASASTPAGRGGGAPAGASAAAGTLARGDSGARSGAGVEAGTGVGASPRAGSGTGAPPGAGARFAWLPAVVTALVYLGVEWLMPKLFADTLGLGFYGSEWQRQGADVAGLPGLTLVLLLGNDCVLALLRALRAHGVRHALRPAAGLLALVLGLTGYGALRHAQVTGATRREPGLVVGAVQANITSYEKLKAELGAYEVVRRVLDTHYALSDGLLRSAPVDLLVWPETVYPTPFGTPKSEAGAELDAEIASYVSERGVPLVFGTYDLEGEREFNAAMFLGPSRQGGALERTAYRKTLLFPLTEWVPDAIDSPTLREWLPWTGRWKRGPGPRAVSFRLRDGRSLTVAPLICYEAIFPWYVADSVRQGAELLLTISNDSWFSGTPGPRQHLVHAAFRSIETRRPQVRVTNSGVSALIDATGAVVAQVDDNQRAGLLMSVPLAAPMSSLALALGGEGLGPLALVLGAALLGAAWLRAARL